jgi:MYXO-CTERM domain-containing protein
VAAGGASGFRIKLIQIVRAGNDNSTGLYTGSMFITYKVQDNSAPLTGSGSFTIPAPGAIALAGLAGLTGRRRR